MKAWDLSVDNADHPIIKGMLMTHVKEVSYD